jgi:hypothetical protein
MRRWQPHDQCPLQLPARRHRLCGDDGGEALPLDFNPAGAAVVIQSGGVVYFTGTVPGAPAP